MISSSRSSAKNFISSTIDAFSMQSQSTRRFATQVPGSTLLMLKDRQELQEVKKLADKCMPWSMFICQWLRVNLDRPGDMGTSSNESCFVDRWPRPNIIAGVDRVDAYGSDVYPRLSMFTTYRVGQRHTPKVELFFRQLFDHIGAADVGGVESRGIDVEWRRVMNDQCPLKASVKHEFCRGYWMPEQQRNQLRRRKIDAPTGFNFGSLEQSDAKLVDDVWPYRLEGTSFAVVQRQIRDFPSVCLREADGAKRLASFMLIEAEVGLMSHVYTMPEFRRRGLATLIEMKLAHLLVEKKFVPAKVVVRGNKGGVMIAEMNPLWKYFGDYVWVRYGNENMTKIYKKMDRPRSQENS